ncbi:MAG: heme o synthase [Gammaproteobacteria bacterium]|nr:heme o synthase [Gammaproteobacteria bacterium]
MFAHVVNVFKLRIGLLIAITAVAGFAVTPGRALAGWQILLLGLCVLGASGAAGAFNQYAERDLDARMTRTRTRPFVTGALTPNRTWLAGILALLLVAVGGAAGLFNGFTAFYVFMGAFTYGVIYTVWLKRRSSWNIVVGGLAGSFAVLAGAAAADPSLSPAAILLAVVLFLWTPPHFWSLAIALHEDYARGGVPMLPVVVGDARAARIIFLNTVALVAVSLLPVFYGMGWIYLAGAASGGSWFLWKSWQLTRTPDRSAAMGNFFASLVQLSLLLGGAMLELWLAR